MRYRIPRVLASGIYAAIIVEASSWHNGKGEKGTVRSALEVTEHRAMLSVVHSSFDVLRYLTFLLRHYILSIFTNKVQRVRMTI